uniref:Uncharacterized protein n=1 Tax=Chelydra serpentina TaxID=8475 RepID=A0A8C3S329_CHESE
MLAEKHVVHFKNTFTADFTKRKEGTNVQFLKIATALDPRFKNLKCLPKSERNEVWSLLSEVLKEQQSKVETTEPKPPKKKINLLLLASDSDDENEHASVCSALDRYRAEPIISMDDKYDMSKTRVAFMMCVTTRRRGAEKDIEIMNKWFDKYQFETPSEQCIDPNGQVIHFLLGKGFRDQINQSKDEISCCLIALMSHGRSHGLIQGKDGDTVDLDDIFALFNNIQCPKLQEKPKIFIIQACRGGEQDIKQCLQEYSCFFPPVGYISLRNTEKGSRMIEAMDEVFSEQGMKWHIGDLFTKVSMQQNCIKSMFKVTCKGKPIGCLLFITFLQCMKIDYGVGILGVLKFFSFFTSEIWTLFTLKGKIHSCYEDHITQYSHL